MGIDFFICCICDEIICDCGTYGSCANCESVLCDECNKKQVEKYGENEPYKAKFCDLCSGVIVTDDDIIGYLLNVVGRSREDVESEIREGK